MIKLEKTLLAYNTADFNAVAKNEITHLDASLLPLQQGLSLSSYVGKSPFSITLLNISDDADSIKLKVGVFYTGIIAGHGDEGNDLHFSAAVTKQRVRLVDTADELRPCPSRGPSLGR